MTGHDSKNPEPLRRTYSPLAGILSFLIPGLGQIYQGRTGKGVLFLACLYGMFFYGMYLGQWKNVYLPRPDPNQSGLFTSPRWLSAIVHQRLAFGGQFWIGIAAWPAIWHYIQEGKANQPLPDNNEISFWAGFQKTPDENELNRLQQQEGIGKYWDLGIIYTVIAGVLNILVIYDAFAGPALATPEGKVKMEADAES